VTKYLLDTDHVSLHEAGHPPLRQRLASISPTDLGVSIVTAEESLRGRVAILSRKLDGAGRLRGYAKLLETLRFYATITIVPFDQACETAFQGLLASRLRIGNRDLKIAATALASQCTLVTRNQRDFAQVPGLLLDDWSVP
jgi:tRNA(fMet)-specific endonuclease VapC